MSSSNSSLVYFTNYTDTLQDYHVHYYYAYVHPVVTLLAAFMNIICVCVLGQRDLMMTGGPFFKYSLVNSITAAVGMLLLCGFAFTRCGPVCPSLGYTYELQAFELYGVIFIGNSLYTFSSLIQIAISLQIYLSITQK